MAIEYDIVYDATLHRLKQTINERLAQGWELQGGVSIAVDTVNSEEIFAQALVRVTGATKTPTTANAGAERT